MPFWLDEQKISRLYQLAEQGVSRKAIAERLGIRTSTVGDYLRKRKKHITSLSEGGMQPPEISKQLRIPLKSVESYLSSRRI